MESLHTSVHAGVTTNRVPWERKVTHHQARSQLKGWSQGYLRVTLSWRKASCHCHADVLTALGPALACTLSRTPWSSLL